MKKLAVYGSDGFGREVLPMLRMRVGSATELVFVDDDQTKLGAIQNGHAVVGFNQALKDECAFVLAIANATIRRALAKKIELAGGQFFEARAKSVVTYDEVEIGEGAILCDNVIVTSNAVIGQHFHANIYSYVAHDCRIGDFVTFAPRVSCNGRVIIEDDVYIGTNAVIRQGSHSKYLTIGKGAVVGMGAVVTKDVPAGSTVVGNPARPIQPKY